MVWMLFRANEVSEDIKRKWSQVLLGLRVATEEKKIKWQGTSIETAFITSLGKHVILLEKLESDREAKYLIRVQDSSGEFIDEFENSDLDRLPFEEQYTQAMASLHLKIRRQISGADAAIDEVLVELGKLDDIPF